MNDDVITDLKQFIGATISQQTSDLREDLQKLDTKLDEISSAVGESIDTANEVTEVQLKGHEARITKLEHKTI